MKRNRMRGNSLVEYALPLIVLFSAGLVALIATDVPQRLADWLSDTMGGEVNGATIAVQPFGDGIQAGSALYGSSAPLDGPVEITLGNGMTISVPDFPIDLAANIETAGGAGTTDKLAATIESIVAALQEAGEISDEEANDLLALAQQGHEIAHIQRFIEEAADKSNGDLKAFYNTRYEYNGQSVRVEKLLKKISASMDEKIWKAMVAMKRDDKGGVLKEFAKLKKAANKSDILTRNPELAAVVDLLSNQIAYSGSVYKRAALDASKGSEGLSADGINALAAHTFRDNAVDFPAYYSSDSNDARSNGICGIGGGVSCKTEEQASNDDMGAGSGDG